MKIKLGSPKTGKNDATGSVKIFLDKEFDFEIVYFLSIFDPYRPLVKNGLAVARAWPGRGPGRTKGRFEREGVWYCRYVCGVCHPQGR